jgi:1,4-alpha-glucan branching enzyme
VNTIQQHLSALLSGQHLDPHTVLGPKKEGIYFFKPGFTFLHVELKGEVVEAKKLDDSGLFFLKTVKPASCLDYKVYQKSGKLTYDPYAFWPTLADQEFEGFLQGIDYTIYKKLGAHSTFHQGTLGVRFAVWAPNAKGVRLSWDDNHFSSIETPMRLLGQSGVFEIFIPGFEQFQKYKFCITLADGSIVYKTDPYGVLQEMRPSNASMFFESPYDWKDQDWMEKKAAFHPQTSPINIYEVHLGSWKKEQGEFLSYEILAEKLSIYCKEMGYTHIEILPVLEHPLDESWGYQVTGFYAATSRFGDPNQFKQFIDILHRNQIGVILDWVGAHFPTDDHGLKLFDGTHLYEHQDPKKGYHPHWNTLIFNYGRHEVSNFLIASVLYWVKEMHVDGIRMDAVSSMLYLDFGRKNGEFIPNKYGGIENLEAIDWLKHLNVVVHRECPGVFLIAEESTAFPKITHPVHLGGLGFDFKSNLGWMNDTLKYLEKDPIYRAYHHEMITFYLMYAFSENFALFLCHDEVVHGKRSLISKMPGSYEDKFKNVKLLLSMMMTLPGKKLLFMGGEFGQWNEWDVKKELDWELLKFPKHQELKRYVQDFNHFYLQHSSFWKKDHSWDGFEWIECNDYQRSVFTFVRKDEKMMHLCVLNASGAHYHQYPIYCSWIKTIVEVFHSESIRYGGWLEKPMPVQPINHQAGFLIDLPPYATIIYALTT